jgi:NIPSNAP
LERDHEETTMPVHRHSMMALLSAGIVSAIGANGHERSGSLGSPVSCCAVLELRQYTLKPGQRDALIALFDRHFIESQEAVGMTIVGQFRDRRRSDRFVWIRGFSDMPSRHAALEQFYGGPVWAEHKAAANTTMLDVSDVRLLKPARPETAFRLDASSRPGVGEERKTAIVLVGIQRLRQPADASIMSRLEQQVVPELRRDGVNVESIFVTESAPNTFPRLPVREGEHLLVWFGTLPRGEAPPAQRLLEASAAFGSLADGPPEVLELEATPRSLLGHPGAAQ